MSHCKTIPSLTGWLLKKRMLHSAYIVYPATRAVEQQKQACYLTKTILHEKTDCGEGSGAALATNRKHLENAIMKCIIDVNFFHRDAELKWNRYTKEYAIEAMKTKFKSDYALPLLMNMMKTVWSSNIVSKGELLSRTMCFRCDLSAPWERNDQKIQVTGKHGHLIKGKDLLPVFADTTEIEETRHIDVAWDDIISPFFDIHQLPTQFTENSGFHDDSPYPYPQTLILFNPTNWHSKNNIGQAIFYSFAHALNCALKNGEKMGEDLKRPIAMQCVTFNGTTFNFVRFQLNTLNLADDADQMIKNIAWATDEMKLYDQVTNKPALSEDFLCYYGDRESLVSFDRKRLSQDLQDKREVRVSVEGLDYKTVNMFIDYMLYPFL